MTEELFKHELDIGEHSAYISCVLDIDPAGNWVELISKFACRSPEGGDDFTIKHKSSISNSIELGVIVGWISTKYAVCIASGFAAQATKEIYVAYGEAKEYIQSNKMEPSLLERAQIFGNKIKGRTNNLKTAALGTFAGCTTAAWASP